MYVHNSLNHSACPNFDDLWFDCSAWSVIKLKDNKSLLLGAVYRSPNSSVEKNQKLLTMLRRASTMKNDYLMICGDFNLPLIDWNSHQSRDAENSLSNLFLEMVEDQNWFQHVKNSTRFRGSQNSCLDLILTNEEYMVSDVQELPPLGKSDHVCQKWKLVVSEPIFKNTIKPRRNYKFANWGAFKTDLGKLEFSNDDSPDAMNDELVGKIKDLEAKHIPLCKPRNGKNRLPWMRGASIKKQREKKWRTWKLFKQSELPRDYDAYKIERNRLGDMIRSSKANHERGLIADMKENPNLFHGHCRRSLKTKQGVSNVIDGNGKLTETEEEAATALDTYYHSVFTKDDGFFS